MRDKDRVGYKAVFQVGEYMGTIMPSTKIFHRPTLILSDSYSEFAKVR